MDEEKKPNIFSRVFQACGKMFKKKEESSAKSNLAKGLVIGLIAALIVLVIILIIAFALGAFRGQKPGGATAAAKAIKLKVTIVASKDCTDCWDTSLFTEALKQQPNVTVTGENTVYTSDAKTKDLISKYKLDKVPTILISGNLSDDQELTKFLTSSMGEIIDKVFVLRQIIPPYIELASGQERGKVAITLITDQSCKTCYDAQLHLRALSNIGIITNNVSTVDISSDAGKSLLKQYNIKKVPTFIMTGDLQAYQGLAQVWDQVGTVASDGTYVFTKVELMGTYMDLAKNKIVKVVVSSTAATAPTATQ